MSTEIEVYQNMPGFEPAQKEMLSESLAVTVIEHRPGGGGRSLAYITGKTAIDTANRIFGFGKWGYRVVARSCEKSVNLDGTITGIFYTADIELYVVGCPFPFPGEGVGIVVPTKAGIVPECHEKARKEAVTDALKRALRHYGDQFGLALYDEDAYVDAGNGTLVQVKNVSKSNANQGKRIVNANQGQALLRWSDIYRDGAARGMWTKENFYTKASALLDGVPISASNVKSLSQEQLQKLQRDVERYQAQEAS